ncbi:hypothetical protein LINPERPRIM_LOCUS16873, partial [Linum perenne]
ILVYPKVKVRSEDEDDRHWGSLLSLKDIQFLTIQETRFPVKLLQDIAVKRGQEVSPSPSPNAKIPKHYVPSLILPQQPETPTTPVSVSTESSATDTKSNPDEGDDRPLIRAGSIPPPRAVLSSPQNDALIGNKNRVAKPTTRPSALRNKNSIQERHVQQCKVMPRTPIDDSAVRSRKSKDQLPAEKTDHKGKKGTSAAVSSRRRPVVEWIN